jgi:hypothetical protein
MSGAELLRKATARPVMESFDHYNLNVAVAYLKYFELLEILAFGDKYGEIAVAWPRQFRIDP